MFNFDYSYLTLPNKFYSLEKPGLFPFAQTFLFNNKLYNEFKLPKVREDKLFETLIHNQNYKKSYAQAYAGHQFGHFTKLGDGRAIIIGEHLTKNKQRFDIQLKGCGTTKYSRNGDGKATLKSMLREYLISEAMHYLNIQSSRSLAVIKTGESICRENKEDGGVLLRVMQSHVRIGTFEYASCFGSNKDLKQLTSYTINRLYPEINNYENPILALLNVVMEKQIDLIVNWMRVGFIHGVMNTDNIAISGETFDYGPCAFINSYNPKKSYSSIDCSGRYAFGNQPKILKWNIFRFAESLLPVIHQNKDKSIQLAKSVIDKFDEIWEKKYYTMMLNKIGINSNKKTLFTLVDKLLFIMKKMNMDFTNTFYYLSQEKTSINPHKSNADFIEWQKKWSGYINTTQNIDEAKNLMRENNPVYIPRNNHVDDAIEKAVNGNISNFNKLLKIFSSPYQYQIELDKFMKPPRKDFEEHFQTFCGT
jgi:uncharacterized protein YdiU (UPF0061 family)